MKLLLGTDIAGTFSLLFAVEPARSSSDGAVSVLAGVAVDWVEAVATSQTLSSNGTSVTLDGAKS